LEHICGSDLLRAEYEDLMRQKAEAEEKTIVTMQKKKMFSNQRKEVKDQKDEAEDFQGKVDQLNQMKVKLPKILSYKFNEFCVLIFCFNRPRPNTFFGKYSD